MQSKKKIKERQFISMLIKGFVLAIGLAIFLGTFKMFSTTFISGFTFPQEQYTNNILFMFITIMIIIINCIFYLIDPIIKLLMQFSEKIIEYRRLK